MACNTQVLRDFDVFATRDNFELNRTCSEFSKPFEQFCLVPPPSRLAQTNTCRPFLDNDLDPSYIFPQTTQGLVETLDDLPIVFVSFPQIESTDYWIRDDEKYQPNDIVDFTNMNYKGFRPVSEASLVLGAAASAVQNQVFCLLSNAAYTDDMVMLYRADTFGIFRTQQDSQGVPIGMRYSTINIQGMPSVACNEDGTIQCACVNNFAYVFNAQSHNWTRLSQTGIITLTVWQNTVVLFSQTQVMFYLPRRIEYLLSGRFVWQCMSLDKNYLFVGTLLGGDQARIFTYDLSMQTLYATATLALSVSLSDQIYLTAIAITGTADTSTLLIARGPHLPVVRITMLNSFQNATQDTMDRFVNNFYNNTCWFEDDSVRFVTGAVVPKPLGMTYKNWLVPANNNDMWSFVEGRLMRLQNQTLWSNDFDLFMDYDARMNDENAQWHFPASIDPPWYYGYIAQNVPIQDQPLPYLFGQSRHNRFRWIFDSIETADNTQFSHLNTHLERINDFFLLTDPGFDTRLYDDANITVANISSTVFETNTHDQSSNPTSYVVLRPIETHPLCTQNGLYVAYINHQNNTRQVVVCYNVFNSSQFADWCLGQSGEFTMRALQQQSTFCFRNLSYEESGTVRFADSRCDCLPSMELFSLRYPDAFANFSSYIATRTIQNIPCLSPTCAKVFLLGQENTNVLNYAREQCKQNLVVCNDALFVQGKLNIDNLSIRQDCGTNNRCTNNAQCPANATCFQGNCITKCANDEYCRNNLGDPLASCHIQSGKCLYGIKTTQQSSFDSTKWFWIAASVVAIVITVILVVVLLRIYF